MEPPEKLLNLASVPTSNGIYHDGKFVDKQKQRFEPDIHLIDFIEKEEKQKRKIGLFIKDELVKILPANKATAIKLSFEEKLGAQVIIPLLAKGEPVGLLGVGNKLKADVFDKEDYDFFKELAERASLDIADAQLREEREASKAQLLREQLGSCAFDRFNKLPLVRSL